MSPWNPFLDSETQKSPVVGDRIEVYFTQPCGVDYIHARGVMVAITSGRAVMLCDPQDPRGQGEHWPASFRYHDQVRLERSYLARLNSNVNRAEHLLRMAMASAKQPEKRLWFGLRKSQGPDELTMTALAVALDALRGVYASQRNHPSNFASQIIYETHDGLVSGQPCGVIVPGKPGTGNAGERHEAIFLCEFSGWLFFRYPQGIGVTTAYQRPYVHKLETPQACSTCGK